VAQVALVVCLAPRGPAPHSGAGSPGEQRPHPDHHREVELPAVFSKDAPEGVEDLRAIETHVQKVLKKVLPATVGLRVGSASGSGVIVSKEGYVLTAGHVSGDADRDVTVILHDGRRLKGKTLGANRGIDSGMIKITDKGDYPFLDMGDSEALKKGEWVIATGHPGGYKPGRSPVVRLGRVANVNSRIVQTDCTLVGGDSGGPLFDMRGRVVGIHSRISGPITANIHVPVNTYRDTWDRLVDAEVWGGRFGSRERPADAYMGVQMDFEGDSPRIAEVLPDSPAFKAGLLKDDVLAAIEGTQVKSFEDLASFLRRKKPGDKVVVDIVRGEKKQKIELVLGKRDDS
jgi:serine protease Do